MINMIIDKIPRVLKSTQAQINIVGKVSRPSHGVLSAIIGLKVISSSLRDC